MAVCLHRHSCQQFHGIGRLPSEAGSSECRTNRRGASLHPFRPAPFDEAGRLFRRIGLTVASASRVLSIRGGEERTLAAAATIHQDQLPVLRERAFIQQQL